MSNLIATSNRTSGVYKISP